MPTELAHNEDVERKEIRYRTNCFDFVNHLRQSPERTRASCRARACRRSAAIFWGEHMQPSQSLLGSIEALVQAGRVVVSTDDAIVLAMMVETLSQGRSATFFVTPAQGQALMRLYWTPARIKEIGMEAVSREERLRIENELGIKDMGPFFSNRIQCSCGATYGAFEFMQQGLQEHGNDFVGAVVALKDVAVLRINPVQDVICARCKVIIITNHWYSMYSDTGKLIYGCCKGGGILA